MKKKDDRKRSRWKLLGRSKKKGERERYMDKGVAWGKRSRSKTKRER